jgi:hypothetical protein
LSTAKTIVVVAGLLLGVLLAVSIALSAFTHGEVAVARLTGDEFRRGIAAGAAGAEADVEQAARTASLCARAMADWRRDPAYTDGKRYFGLIRVSGDLVIDLSNLSEYDSWLFINRELPSPNVLWLPRGHGIHVGCICNGRVLPREELLSAGPDTYVAVAIDEMLAVFHPADESWWFVNSIDKG